MYKFWFMCDLFWLIYYTEKCTERKRKRCQTLQNGLRISTMLFRENEDGARVVRVENLDNPYKNQQNFDKRFKLTMNKLYAWSLVEYERVVMLDADNLFLRKTDELFQCGQFCAVFINPCIFHTGLFVLEVKIYSHFPQK